MRPKSQEFQKKLSLRHQAKEAESLDSKIVLTEKKLATLTPGGPQHEATRHFLGQLKAARAKIPEEAVQSLRSQCASVTRTAALKEDIGIITPEQATAQGLVPLTTHFVACEMTIAWEIHDRFVRSGIPVAFVESSYPPQAICEIWRCPKGMKEV